MAFDVEKSIGQLTVRYHANVQKVAGLILEIKEAGRLMSDLGRALSDDPAMVTVTDAEFQSTVRAHGIPRITLSTIAGYLEELHEALEDKKRMEECLRQSGLGGLVR